MRRTSGTAGGGAALSWLDVDVTIGALEAHHQCRITIVVTRVPRSPGLLQVAITATHVPTTASLASPFEEQTVAVCCDYLAGGSTRLEAQVWAWLLHLDTQLDKVLWAQQTLPGLEGNPPSE